MDSSNMFEQFLNIHPTILWIVILSLIVSFILAFGIGANDVANSFGTSVGAGVLTLKQACILATIFETLGAVLIGAKVSDTIRKKIIDLDVYNDDLYRKTAAPLFTATSSPHTTAFNMILNATLAADLNSTSTSSFFGLSTNLPIPRDCAAHPRLALLMVGQLSSLIGCCGWLFIATFFGLPVSGTHSIVGATLGFALIANGFSGINWWPEFARIVASWFISPLSSGLVSVLLFWLVRRGVLERVDQLESGLRLLPLIYGVTIVINFFSILLEAPPLLYMDLMPLGGKFIIAFAVATIASVVVKFLVVPFQRKRIQSYIAEKEPYTSVSEYQSLGAARANGVDADDSAPEGQPEAQPLPKPQPKPQALSPGLTHSNPKLDSKEDDSSARPADAENKRPEVGAEAKKTGKFIVERIPSAPKPLGDLSDNVTSSSVKFADSTPSRIPSGQEQSENILSPALLENRTATPAPSNSEGKSPGAADSKSNSSKKNKTSDGRVSPSSQQQQPPPQEPSKSESGSNVAAGAADDEAAGGGAVATTAAADEEVKQLLDGEARPEGEQQPPLLVDPPETARLFSVLQILTAIFGSFAHGGNDVSNAIGPLIGIWIMATSMSLGQRVAAPSWILAYGGAGISVGLWVWGRRVMQTLASGLTVITPSSGFCIELGTALTVLCASNLGLPISTTHCKVGSVVGVGWFRSRDNVHWSTFRNIAFAWGVTVPASAALGALSMLGLRFLLNYICTR